MKNRLILTLGIAVALVLLGYMLLFQVQENEVAVRATFGSADESSIITDKGLHLRLPWPFQQIHRYSTRTQLAETALDQSQTADGYAIIVKLYLTWKVDNPLDFYKSLKDEETARNYLVGNLRNSQGALSRFKFSQIVNVDEKQLKLNDIEASLLAEVTAGLKSKSFGVSVDHVGIRRIVLPQTVNQKVFERMKSDRENLAAGVKTRGTAQANAIVAEAKAIKESILSFANKHAEEIRTKGKTQAAEVYKEFAKDEEFGIFLSQMDALEKILKNNTTFLIDATKVDEYSPFRLLIKEPGSAVKPPLRPASP